MHILTALNGKFTRFSKKCFYKLSRWHFVEAITLFVWKSLDLKTKKSYSMTEKAGASMPFFTKEKKKRFCISKYLSEEADQWAITVWAKATDTCSAESLTVRGEAAWMLISVLSNDEEGAGATEEDAGTADFGGENKTDARNAARLLNSSSNLPMMECCNKLLIKMATSSILYWIFIT